MCTRSPVRGFSSHRANVRDGPACSETGPGRTPTQAQPRKGLERPRADGIPHALGAQWHGTGDQALISTEGHSIHTTRATPKWRRKRPA